MTEPSLHSLLSIGYCHRILPSDIANYHTRKVHDIISYHIFVIYRCWSYVGKVGGQQYMSLSDGCQLVNIILHEFMHAIGFFHEHSRRDRDRYIRVNWENIDQSKHFNI